PYQIEGRLDQPALAASLDLIVKRHEVLRSTFPVDTGKPVLSLSEQGVSMEVVDLRDSLGEAPNRAEEIVKREASRDFDLPSGPLYRAKLLRLSDQVHVLSWCVHHIVYDAWSNDVFLRELAVAYRAFSRGQEPQLPDLPLQFPDYAGWEREW